MESVKTVRINKALADAGVCSRRKADELINLGLVRVNDELVASPGLQVHPWDRIEVSGKPLQRQSEDHKPCYLMLNKPVQVVSTASDPEGRTTVLDLVPAPWKTRRLYPAGRLDYFSEGLLLLTDDGELTNRITHPRHHLPRVYRVRVREEVTPAALSSMRTGMTLAEGETLVPMDVRVLPSPPGRGTVLSMTLHQGLNRQIRRVCRDLGLTILTLSRVAQGPLQLGDLPSRGVRELSGDELHALRQAVGLA